MIKYALRCAGDHAFEGWFASSVEYDRQEAAGELACPICDTPEVEKALMAPAIARGAKSAKPSDADAKLALFKAKMNEAARKVRDHVHRNFEGVGERFPEEARRIHYGEAPDRPIYGEASPDEARALAEEGVTVAPVPQPDDELPAKVKGRFS